MTLYKNKYRSEQFRIENWDYASPGYYYVDASSHGIEFACQARYHDDVITSLKELNNIRKYIRQNPVRWIERLRWISNPPLQGRSEGATDTITE